MKVVKPYEVEARFIVSNDFKDKLEKMGFKVTKEYRFTDHFFRPRGGWRGNKSLRARDWGEFCEVLFDHIEVFERDGIKVKRSIYPEGKVKLYEGTLESCLKLLEDMEFEKCGEIKKDIGYLMSDGELMVALEKINGKWVLEIELNGEDLDKAIEEMKKAMRKLGLGKPSGTSTRELFGLRC
ncbi:hypothetical protein IPA_05755 [Ignicoccus pacificus DSM 13166]|uniref:CYTH domain-containing protein n=1 Tax=Ignicoccus pacificus DSM 13166 TaxID=940294 RepID=A0A977PL04_9CREN|nr:hypothetical protein IPA_05755 [Ignicoccus pacificus DSM 13166]